MQPKKKPGRPKNDVRLTQVTFKADDQTLSMLDDLCADVVRELGGIVNGGKSQAIRRAIELAHRARTPVG